MKTADSSTWQSMRLQGLPENKFRELTALKQKIRKTGATITDLSEGLPDVPPHPRLLAYLSKLAIKPEWHCYPTRWGGESLRQQIKQFLFDQFSVDQQSWSVIPVSGSKEVFAHLSQILLNPGDVALIPAPGYPAYPVAVQYAGAHSVRYSMTPEGIPEFDKLDPQILRKARLLFLNTPNNPTGITVSSSGIRQVLDFCARHNIVLCQDMAYAHLLETRTPAPSALSIANADQAVVEVHSSSKSLSTPGWRFGFAAGNDKIIESIELSKAVFDTGIFPLVQKAARYALIHFDEFSQTPWEIYRSRKRLVAELLGHQQIGIDTDSGGIFIWLEVNQQAGSGSKLTTELLKSHNILVLPGATFAETEDRHVRVSLTVADEVLQRTIPLIGQMIGSKR